MSPSTPVAPASSPLVNVFPGQIGGVSVPVCDARELHAVLDNLRQFADWIKDRVEFYGFVENQDFAICSLFREQKKRGRQPKDYHLTLDMAKELCMVENNPQGRAARRYFIACEREAKQKAKEAAPALPAPKPDRERQSRINKRAWQLAHLAYEAYRQEMQTCSYLESGIWQIEDWKPRLLSEELISVAQGMATFMKLGLDRTQDLAERMRKMTGEYS